MPEIDESQLEDLDAAADRYAGAFAQVAEGQRQRLREDFVRQALPFASRLARRYRRRGELNDDLEQVARLGLVKAIDRYDPERGSFTAFAVITITGEIKRHFRDHTWGVHVPRRLQDLGIEVSQATTLLTARLARAPTTSELAAHLGVGGDEVAAAQASAAGYSPASLNAPAGGDGTAEMGDLYGLPDPELSLVDDWATVERLLCHLPERERRMLALRFYGNRSQSEIAEELGISQMHVSRLLSRALSWLRQAMLTDIPPRWAGEDSDHRLTVVTVAEPGAIRAHVTGEVDRDNAGHLREALLAAVRHGGHRLIIDLVGVPLLDAAGVGVLLAVYEAARVRNVQVRVVGLQPYVARIVAVSGLGTLLDD